MAAMDVVPHIMAVPPQPVNNSIPGLVKPIPKLLNVIVGLAVCATNLYHTSYTTAPAQSAVIATAVNVAPYILLVTLLQVVADVSVITLPQRSFADGGSSTQIVNVFETPVE